MEPALMPHLLSLPSSLLLYTPWSFSIPCTIYFHSLTFLFISFLLLSPPVLLLGEHLRICPQGYTCCTSDMEDNLAALSRRELEGLLKEDARTLQMALLGHYKAFDGECLCSYKCVRDEYNDIQWASVHFSSIHILASLHILLFSKRYFSLICCWISMSSFF